MEFRLSKAAFMLEDSDKTIGEIANGVGFHQISHFGKCFKEKPGYSPRDYRKSGQKTEADTFPGIDLRGLCCLYSFYADSDNFIYHFINGICISALKHKVVLARTSTPVTQGDIHHQSNKDAISAIS